MPFNLYFAGWGSKEADEYLRKKKAHRLLSWANEQRVINWWQLDKLANNLFIDSGAFSVAHSGADINLDNYIANIKNNSDIGIWAELDIIPYPVLNSKTVKESSNKSWENYIYMKSNISDSTILPIYHFGEPREGLLRILNTPVNGKLSDYIGIGGRHGVSTEAQISYFKDVFNIIQHSDNPKVKVHAFGITVPRILENFPFFSADSTTWLQVAINGGILTEDLQTIRVSNNTTNDKTNLQTMPKEALYNVIPVIEKYGYSYDNLCKDYKERLCYNIDVMLNWEQHYTYKGPKEFKSQKLF
jgi:hypothetical protein